VTVHQIRASRARIGPPHSLGGSLSGPLLAADELTILTSWAEALAEALAVAPKRIESLAADAQAGAPWRGELRICEPSASLREAISGIFRAVRTAAPAAGDSPLDAALLAVHGSQPGQSPLDRLARAALRSTLQQRQARQADEASGPRICSLPMCRATRRGQRKPAARRRACEPPGYGTEPDARCAEPRPAEPTP
jgi:hypothetical protein